MVYNKLTIKSERFAISRTPTICCIDELKITSRRISTKVDPAKRATYHMFLTARWYCITITVREKKNMAKPYGATNGSAAA